VKDHECGHCKGFHNDEEEVKYVKLGNDMNKVAQEFCYLGDVDGSSGDVHSLVMAKICAAVLARENLVSCLKYYVGGFYH